ncbi:MAG: redoxin family protein [Terriglobales bacterium]
MLLRWFIFMLCCLMGGAAAAQSSPETDALKQAHELFNQKKYKECQKLLKDTVKRYPNCSDCYIQLASFDERFGDFPEAVENAGRAVKAATTDVAQAAAHLYRCELLAGTMGKKELAIAEQDCRDVLRVAPNTPDAHLQLGLVLMREKRDEEGLPEVKTYVERWPTASYVSYAKKVLVNPRAAKEPVAPDFTVTCESGKKISYSELAGKVVVIDFWATWCPACRAALPEMKELIKKYPSDKLVVISASADQDENAWRDYITKKEMTWPQVLDKDDSLTTVFGVNAFPTYIVIDGDGFIRKRIVGTDPQKSLAYQLKAELKAVFENSAH